MNAEKKTLRLQMVRPYNASNMMMMMMKTMTT